MEEEEEEEVIKDFKEITPRISESAQPLKIKLKIARGRSPLGLNSICSSPSNKDEEKGEASSKTDNEECRPTSTDESSTSPGDLGSGVEERDSLIERRAKLQAYSYMIMQEGQKRWDPTGIHSNHRNMENIHSAKAILT